MKNSFKRTELIGIVFVWIIGSLLHFTYEWSGNAAFTAIVAPVNESPWERLKILFFPVTLYALFEFFFLGKKFTNFATAKLIGVISGMAFILIAFYTYYGVFGQVNLLLDIAIFLGAVFLTYSVSCFHCLYRSRRNVPLKLASAMIAFIAVCFVIFTIYPPSLPLFGVS